MGRAALTQVMWTGYFSMVLLVLTLLVYTTSQRATWGGEEKLLNQAFPMHSVQLYSFINAHLCIILSFWLVR